MCADSDPKPKRVLVVEDDAGVQHILAFTLRRAGYDVVTASTGTAGVSKASEAKPDLILMDVMMPGIDGFEATRRIRQSPEGRNVPIIFLTVMDDYASRTKGDQLGANDYMAKPVRLEELVERVAWHLAQRKDG